MQFNIFKGLVLRNLKIYDLTTEIVNIREGACTFVIWPVFKKNIIFPVIKIKTAEIFLERKSNNTLNLTDLFPRNNKEGTKKSKFNIFVNRIIITDARIKFQDDTLTPVFTKIVDRINADIVFSPPSSLRFNLKGAIVSKTPMEISASGDFNIAAKKLSSKISFKNFPTADFLVYYNNLNISVFEGPVDILAELEFKDDILSVHSRGKVNNLILSKDKIQLRIDSDVSADIKYDFKNKQLVYQGKAGLQKANISGLDFVGEINDIIGLVNFDNSGLSCDKIIAKVAGEPLEASVSFSDFSKPALSINIRELSLSSAQKIIKDRFNVAAPFSVIGKANLFVVMETRPAAGPIQINGHLDLLNADVKLDKIDAPIEAVGGSFEFSRNRLKWQELSFRYLGMPYTMSGALTDFSAPQIQLRLSSQHLFLESNLLIAEKSVEVTQLKGKYLNSEFSVSGKINLLEQQELKTEASGTLNIELKDIASLKKFQSQLERINPAGSVVIAFNLSGDINDFKSCAIDAKLSSSLISFCGLKASDLSLLCRQAGGILEIPSMHFSFYDGTLDLNAAMNMNTEHLPYRISVAVKDMKIEKLKLDTAAKEKDIAGTIQLEAKLNGFSSDLSKLSGVGVISVSEGRLWQLNLFQGLGKLIFASDFANIVFSEGNCGFIVKDNYVSSDTIKLKSNLVELTGEARIGFDTSVDASISIHVLDEMAPLTSTLKDVATAIIGESGVFGLIKISGTLQQSKFKFQPAIADIFKGIKRIFKFP